MEHPTSPGSAVSALEREVKLRQRAEILLKVAKAMRSDLDLPAVLQDAVDVTWQFLQPDFAGLFLVDGARHFTLSASVELTPIHAETRWPMVQEESFLTRTLVQGSPVSLVRFAQEAMTLPEAAFFQPDAATCCSAIPIMHQGTPSGVLVLLWRHPDHDHQEDDHELLIGIAELIALAIENQRLIQREATIHSEKILAEEIAKEREALIRQIVHDLRNATQAISLVNEELELAAPDNPTVLHGVSAIDRQITFISNFLKEKIHRIKGNQGEARERLTAIAPMLDSLAERFSPRFAERRQTFAWVSAEEGVQVPMAEEVFERMLAHLLDNANKYAPELAHVKLWCALSDGWATLYVSNTGPGIPIEDQARIEQPGFRGRHDVPGEGMGLAEVKQLVTAHSGLFGLTSRAGAGSTFYVTLPTTQWGRA
ncbi:MAG TPA: HAMP domain-containing sensor histidine kinase [Pantanalinema sp.]